MEPSLGESDLKVIHDFIITKNLWEKGIDKGLIGRLMEKNRTRHQIGIPIVYIKSLIEITAFIDSQAIV